MEDFIDGDLEKKLKEECESHIKDCFNCKEKAANFEKCIEFFKCCMPDTKPPEGMKGWMSRFMAQCCGDEKIKNGKDSTDCCN